MTLADASRMATLCEPSQAPKYGLKYGPAHTKKDKPATGAGLRGICGGETVPAFINQIAQTESMSAKALELIILTACRAGEALGATWDEIDLERGEWLIPAQRMKAGREHRVPLSKRAVSLLMGLPRVQGSPYVFPGQRPDRHLSAGAVTMFMRRHGAEGFTVHGFRSSFRDWAAERTTYPREICEMCLAHVVAQGAEAAYWRGDVLEKRRGLMELWGQYVGDADNAGGVVIKIA